MVRNDGHMKVHIELTRRRDALPITLDYMAEAEQKYREAAGPSTTN